MASLLLPKLLYFLFFGGFGAVNSFLPVFFQDDKGLSLTQIGILGMLSPLVKFLGAPSLSALADYTRQHRLILYICLSLSVLFRASLIFVRNGFPTCVVFVILAETLGSVGAPIFENGVLELLPDKALYGKQRLFGAAGYGVAVLVSGLLIQSAGASWPMFINQIVLLSAFGAASLKLPLPSDRSKAESGDGMPLSIQAGSEEEDIGDNDDDNDDRGTDENEDAPADNDRARNESDSGSDTSSTASIIIKELPDKDKTDLDVAVSKPRFVDVWNVITQDVYTTIFFSTIVLSGFGAGVIENFLFIYIEELNGTKTIQGLARFVMCAAEIPLFFFSGFIFDRLGTTGCLTLTFLAFIGRFVFYAYMTNPWTVVAAEPLHGITFAVMWTAATRQAHAMAPPGLGTTMQGVLGGMHFGLGSGLGALIGGGIYQRYGSKTTFLTSAGTAAASLVLLWTAELYRRSQRSSRPVKKYSVLTQEDVSDDEARSNDSDDGL
eukprot:TRINITY_DN8803_c0_g1_i1.p1 TRINITY_DN8803_c0_g1~~TRINITY_DN8803_c0_g1_i1.p1  ORF type:complete len:493 (+),score=124.96 TRINITY_DN8803_c0_g1_i1:92-1570(+)